LLILPNSQLQSFTQPFFFCLSADRFLYHRAFARIDARTLSLPARPAITFWQATLQATNLYFSSCCAYRSACFPQTEQKHVTLPFTLPLCPHSFEQTTCLLSLLTKSHPQVLQLRFSVCCMRFWVLRHALQVDFPQSNN
jgi:hypothetical protein